MVVPWGGVIETARLAVRLATDGVRPAAEDLTFDLLRPAPAPALEGLVLEGADGEYDADLTAVLAGEELLAGEWSLEVLDGEPGDGVVRLEG